ncbi:MarC family protein [Basilea psittacipulmonis]|uniref:UPF0056 membrane protein n=1 Tax=Basilea psittacipulmonis DSM 24701 TaxID=1072685 RepID=A0A077DCL3_9BURK|nr:MarC family protein [Basilea psittacipulmonis]AIL32625.1 antibiotic resistance protein [Basilea psittacipulmonis DSM 24701]
MTVYESFIILTQSFLLIIGTILPIINPPGAAPIFLSFTKGASQSVRQILAKRIAINTFIILTISTWIGSIILGFFGISIPIVRLGGGLLVMSSAWSLLNAKDVDADTTEAYAESHNVKKAEQSTFFPFTFPILCGPGSISAAITIGSVIHGQSDTGSFLLSSLGNLLGIFALAVMVYFCLRFATKILHFLGETGTLIFMKLSAFILLCIGIQIVWLGLHDLYVQLYYETQTPTIFNFKK